MKRDADDQCLPRIVAGGGAHQAKEALGDGTPALRSSSVSAADLSRDEQSMSATGAHAETHSAGAREQHAIGFGAG